VALHVIDQPTANRSTACALSDARDDQLAFQLFAVTTGIAALVLFSERRFTPELHRGFIPMSVAVPVCLAVLMVWRPSSVPVFLAFWLTNTYYLLLGFPENNTNQTLTFFVGLAVLGAAVGQIARAGTFRLSGAKLFADFSPAARLSVVALYFWTIWHKLNTDFVNPDVSCAARLSADMLEGFGFQHFPPPLAAPAVGLTLLAEALLPVGLFCKRTQRLTALFGLLFHWLLGVAGFYGFSATMMSLLTLFLAPSAGRAFSGYAAHIRINRSWLVVYVGSLLASEIILRVGASGPGKAWWLALPLVFAVIWYVNRSDAQSAFDTPEPIWRLLLRPRVLYLVPLALFLNGASPFVGYKTEYSYAMYSNLRTEGGKTNHLLWKTPLRLADYQTDLVEVMKGSEPALYRRLGGRPVTRYELTSTLWLLTRDEKRGPIRLIVESNGQRQIYESADTDPDLMKQPTFLERKLLRFRRIVEAEPGRCEH
jgi:hypothetical protein